MPGKHLNDEEMALVIEALKCNEDNHPSLKKLRSFGRGLKAAISLFDDIQGTILKGMNKVFVDGQREYEVEMKKRKNQKLPRNFDYEERQKVYLDYMEYEYFDEVLMATEGHGAATTNLLSLITACASAARGTDITNISSKICEFVSEVDRSRMVYDNGNNYCNPLPVPESGRGWNHLLFGQLLLPLKTLFEWREETEEAEYFMACLEDVASGKICLPSGEWPAFLYADGVEYDEDNDVRGLFRGSLLLKIYRYIFTGPKTASDGKPGKGGRQSRAYLMAMNTVTGRSIAYVCVIARTCLMGKGWRIRDGHFDYLTFYYNIVRMFEDDPDDPWVLATLQWWNARVHFVQSRAADPEESEEEEIDSEGRLTDPIARMKAQREAKKKAHESASDSTGIIAEDPTSGNKPVRPSPSPATDTVRPSPSPATDTVRPSPSQATETVRPSSSQATNAVCPSSSPIHNAAPTTSQDKQQVPVVMKPAPPAPRRLKKRQNDDPFLSDLSDVPESDSEKGEEPAPLKQPKAPAPPAKKIKLVTPRAQLKRNVKRF